MKKNPAVLKKVSVSLPFGIQPNGKQISCLLSKTHRGKGLKPFVTELSGKPLCNLNVQQLKTERKAAWSLYVELVTRIAVEQMVRKVCSVRR